MEQKLIKGIVNALEEIKTSNIQTYNVGDKSPLADYFIVAGADNMLTIDAARTRIDKFMNQFKLHLRNPNENWKGGWLIMDYGNIVVNVFLEEKRQFYNLDGFIQSGNIDLNEIKNVSVE